MDLGYGWLNLASFIIGCIALILPIVNLIRGNESTNKNWATFSLVSLSSCGVSIWIQILHASKMVDIGDFTALMDTFSAVTLISGGLVLSTIILNVIILLRYYRNKS